MDLLPRRRVPSIWTLGSYGASGPKPSPSGPPSACPQGLGVVEGNDVPYGAMYGHLRPQSQKADRQTLSCTQSNTKAARAIRSPDWRRTVLAKSLNCLVHCSNVSSRVTGHFAFYRRVRT